MTRISGTEGYAEEAPALLRQYESITFEQAQGSIVHLIPRCAARVLDIGAGTGRDAAWFAADGHATVAADFRPGARQSIATPALPTSPTTRGWSLS